MNTQPKTFKQRPFYTSFLKNILGTAIKEIQVDEDGIIFKTRRKESQYLWSQVKRVDLISGTIRGGYPGSSAVMKRTLKITTSDNIYELDVSPHRSQIKDHPELIKALEKHVKVGKTSSP